MSNCVTEAARSFALCSSLSLVVAATACSGPAATGPTPVAPENQTATETPTRGSDETETPTPKNIADFSLETVDGKTVSLSDYVGKKVILLDFWATWCEPCLAAMPHLNEIYKDHKDEGFVLLSISMDGPDTVAEVRSYTQRHNLDFPVLLDQESRAVSLYNPKRSAPYSVLIAKDGTILHKRDGYQPGDEVEIEDEVVEALAR